MTLWLISPTHLVQSLAKLILAWTAVESVFANLLQGFGAIDAH